MMMTISFNAAAAQLDGFSLAGNNAFTSTLLNAFTVSSLVKQPGGFALILAENRLASSSFNPKTGTLLSLQQRLSPLEKQRLSG
jgi:hypothetical protein